MFFIFGWNKPIVTSYGQVLEHTCPNCGNTKLWHLNKVSRYFSLFFIPVFAHSTDYWYFCPVCTRGIRLDAAAAEHYKSIAETNQAYLDNKITDEERIRRIEGIQRLLGPAEV